jgi:NADPH-dependent glutamate synthase beta subunit-like oxidoreductase/dihydroorotate dehydrogenase/Pyruvate/2-oxoacid:ferredoxin oxidoreductase delta subunit
VSNSSLFFSEGQLASELERCLYCADKPCWQACPAHCSPADFIMAARMGRPEDYGRSAARILASNPLGEICGMVCPDTFCMDACTRRDFDRPIEIPKVQATIVHMARALKSIPATEPPPHIGKKVAVVGGGSAGLAAAGTLARKGYSVEIFEREPALGGACRLIPAERLSPTSLDADIDGVLKLGNVKTHLNSTVENPASLLASGFSAVVVTVGQQQSSKLGITGDDLATDFISYLRNPERFGTPKRVAVVGGGAVAIDCALIARKQGAVEVEMFVRRTLTEMPITAAERELLFSQGVNLTTRTRIERMERGVGGVVTLQTIKTEPQKDATGKIKLIDIPGTSILRPGFDLVVYAIGTDPLPLQNHPRTVLFAGDCLNGETTVVEAAAAGKNAAIQIDLLLSRSSDEESAEYKSITAPGSRSRIKSRSTLDGISRLPVPLHVDFFGMRLENPFLLSAAPHTDGFDQMKLGLEAGWAGGIMKTAFDNIPIHIPNNYMFNFGTETYGNCDNVSGHSLDRVAGELERLRKLFPTKLIAGSTGGSVTGNDEIDRRSWQSNTKKLENAGSMLVEYSLSCPQGGDGTEGAIVSQNAALSAKIIDWVMEAGDPSVPKLFKLTGQVTSIQSILRAIAAVFAKYPHKKGGVTLANSFPALGFRTAPGRRWDEGVVVGLSGEGILPISYLSLANVAGMGVTISGNGGVMNYLAAASFLALGAGTVQCCTLPMRHGVGIIDELCSGLSHLLWAKGMHSVEELIGCTHPRPITDFMDLSATKQISDRHAELCRECGKCSHCGYQAITMGPGNKPVTDASKCVGCSICVRACFAKAMFMRERTPSEREALKE